MHIQESWKMNKISDVSVNILRGLSRKAQNFDVNVSRKKLGRLRLFIIRVRGSVKIARKY